MKRRRIKRRRILRANVWKDGRIVAVIPVTNTYPPLVAERSACR